MWMLSIFFYLLCSISPTGIKGQFYALIITQGLDFTKKIPWQTHPLLFLMICAVIFFAFQIKSQFWFELSYVFLTPRLVMTLGYIVTAPLKAIRFQDFFLADQLVSISIGL